MRYFYLLILFLFSSYSASAQHGRQDTIRFKAKTDSVFKIVTFGVPDFEKENAINVVGSKWGIQYIRMTGVMYPKEFVDSINAANIITEKKIVKIYGKKWKKEFAKEVEKEHAVHIAMIKELETEPEVKALKDSTEKAGHYIEYFIITVNWSDQYEIIIKGPGEAEGYLAMYAYRIYFYNQTSKVATLLSRRRMNMSQ